VLTSVLNDFRSSDPLIRSSQKLQSVIAESQPYSDEYQDLPILPHIRQSFEPAENFGTQPNRVIVRLRSDSGPDDDGVGLDDFAVEYLDDDESMDDALERLEQEDGK
jgi:hypothetical protein